MKIFGGEAVKIFAQGRNPVVDIEGVFAINQTVADVAVNTLVRDLTGAVGNIPLGFIIVVFPIFRFKMKRKNPTVEKSDNEDGQNW